MRNGPEDSPKGPQTGADPGEQGQIAAPMSLSRRMQRQEDRLSTDSDPWSLMSDSVKDLFSILLEDKLTHLPIRARHSDIQTADGIT